MWVLLINRVSTEFYSSRYITILPSSPLLLSRCLSRFLRLLRLICFHQHCRRTVHAPGGCGKRRLHAISTSSILLYRGGIYICAPCVVHLLQTHLQYFARKCNCIFAIASIKRRTRIKPLPPFRRTACVIQQLNFLNVFYRRFTQIFLKKDIITR